MDCLLIEPKVLQVGHFPIYITGNSFFVPFFKTQKRAHPEGYAQDQNLVTNENNTTRLQALAPDFQEL